MPSSATPICYLFDNGSLRPASTLSLRRIAAELAGRLAGSEVRPVSLLHSSGVAAEALEGRRAELLEPALVAAGSEGLEEAVLVPLFFGPSEALTSYLPERIEAVRGRCPGLRVAVAPPLVDLARAPEDDRLATILAEHVRVTRGERDWDRPWVVLVDHGSPQAAVSAVRDHLGRQLGAKLGGEVAAVRVASMERRDGEAYAHADPLLAAALTDPTLPAGPTVIAMQFLQPGRHAGPQGDVAKICTTAEEARPGLRTAMTPLVGTHPLLLDVLAERYAHARRTLEE